MVPQNAQATHRYPPMRGTTPMSSRVFVQVWDAQSRKDVRSRKGVRLKKDEREAVNEDENDSEGETEDGDGEYERPWFVDDIEGGTGIASRKQQR